MTVNVELRIPPRPPRTGWCEAALALLLCSGCGSDSSAPQSGILWSYEHPDGASLSSPAAGPDELWVFGTTGSVAEWSALDQRSGSRVHGPHATRGLRHAPVMIGERVQHLTLGGQLLTFDLSGAELSAVPNAGLGNTTRTAISPDERYVAFASIAVSNTLVIATPNGDLVAEIALGSAIPSAAPAWVDDERVLVGLDTGQVLGFEATGQEFFRTQSTSEISSLSGTASTVFVGDASALRSLSIDGAERFVHERGGPVRGILSSEDGQQLAVWGDDGKLEIIDSTQGTVTASYEGTARILADAIWLDASRVAFFDEENNARALGLDGTTSDPLALPGAVTPQVARAQNGNIAVTIESKLHTLFFIDPDA